MNNEYILLVEDNEDDELLIQRAWKKADVSMEVAVVRDGVEALEFLREKAASGSPRQGLPQIILLDLSLPRMSGLELLARLKQDPKIKSVPIIVLTSSKEEKDIVQSYKLGANSYVIKPVDFVQLSATIKQLSQYWLGLNQSWSVTS